MPPLRHEREMGDLHSMAYSSSCLHSSSLGWDLHNLGVFNADMSSFMDSTPPFFSSLDSDPSTGYLQDALVEFGDRSKRRRLLLYTDDDQSKGLNDRIKSYWNSNCTWDLSEKFNCMSQTSSSGKLSDEPISTSVVSRVSEEANMFTEIETPEEAILYAPETHESSSSSYKDSLNTDSLADKGTLLPIDPITSSGGGGGGGEKRKKRVVYPFAVVKPGGVEGDVTLNDINERILMPPTRPVRHPVGDFACRPCISAHGPGLSGKAVVAFTRIQTQGRGTITIIRTKG